MSLQMPQAIELPRAGLGEQLGLGIATGLQGALSTFMEEQKQKRHGKIFREEFGKLSEDPSSMEIQGTLSRVLERGVPLESAIKFGSLYSSLKRTEPKGVLAGKTKDEISQVFQDLGMPQDVANKNASLYSSLTTGGQTKFGEMLIDQIQRGQLSGFKTQTPQQFDEAFRSTSSNPEPSSPRANVEAGAQPDFQWPEVAPFEGLTAKEKIKRQSELASDNNNIYKTATDNLKNSLKAETSVKQLDRLNETGKLPAGLQRINVNPKTGDLIFPAAANPETQLYVKTVNEFVKGAKEAFGARVTNFELDRFMAQLPTLANTKEGRRLIMEQMKSVNQINQLYDDSLKEVYRKYGTRNIDPVEAETIAERLRSSKEAALKERINNLVDEVELRGQRTSAMASPTEIQVGQQIESPANVPVGTILRRGNRRFRVTEQGLMEVR